MTLRYSVTIDDLIAFNRYHCAHSPAVKKTKLTSMVVVSAVVIVGALLVPTNLETTRVILVTAAVIFAALYCIVLNWTYPRCIDRQVRRLCNEGTNKGMFGQHELLIDEDGLLEKTEFNESRIFWQGIERIAETEQHVFIYISSLMAHVIPKDSVTAGNVNQFLAHTEQLWLKVNPDNRLERAG